MTSWLYKGGFQWVGCPLSLGAWSIVSNMIFWCTLFLSLIWLFRFVSSYAWNLSRVSVSFPFFVMYTLFMISSVGQNVWLLSKRCCEKLDFPYYIFNLGNILWISYERNRRFVRYISCYSLCIPTGVRHFLEIFPVQCYGVCCVVGWVDVLMYC